MFAFLLQASNQNLHHTIYFNYLSHYVQLHVSIVYQLILAKFFNHLPITFNYFFINPLLSSIWQSIFYLKLTV